MASLTQLVAPEAMLRRFRKMQRQEGVQAFLRTANKQHTITQRLPAERITKPVSSTPSEKLGEPTPERTEKAVGATKTTVPPFNSQILGAVQKFAKQLGPETMLVLERLYEVGIKGNSSHGLTSGYDGIKVDSSRSSYGHLSADESDAHEVFRLAMSAMPLELQRFARELVLEETGPHRNPRSMAEIGTAITGYEDHRYARGAVVATLKIIAWCVQTQLSVKRRK